MTQPLRFCLVTTFYPPFHFGGDAVYTYRLAHALAGRGHHVEVIHCRDAFHLLHPERPGAFPATDPAIRVHTLESGCGALSPLLTQVFGAPGLKAAAIRRILDEGAFDVIHFHNISLVGGPRLLAYGRAVKLYTLHEYWLVCPTHVLFKYQREPCVKRACLRCCLRYRRPLQYWRYTGLVRRMARHVDAFISPSGFTAAKHRELGLQGRFEVIPMFAEDPPASAAAAPPTEGVPYYLFVGRLEKLKGLQTVIPLIRPEGPAHLFVAGEGSYEGELRRRAGRHPRIRFLGPQSPEALAGLYRHARAVIVPSLCYETFGQVVAEAFAAGTPVLARDIGALGELVTDSGGGSVYRTDAELSALLERLVCEPALRDALGRKGREAYCRRLTERHHVSRYLDLVTDLAGAK